MVTFSKIKERKIKIIRHKRIKFKSSLRATIPYNKKTANRFHDLEYYKVSAEETLELPLKRQRKEELESRKQRFLTKRIRAINALADKKTIRITKTLKGIYDKNTSYAFEGGGGHNLPSILTYCTLQVVSHYWDIIMAYRKIRGNKGALTEAYVLSEEKYLKFSGVQKSLLNQSHKFPDGITKSTFYHASNLLRKGLYPWGASRRIYVDKPGRPPGTLRPITIPPFMDRIVQTAILMVLEAIYGGITLF